MKNHDSRPLSGPSQPPITVASLHLYPVKGCRGVTVDTVSADAFGPIGDRRFMVVDAGTGRFVSQRSHPAMATICATLAHDVLQLSRAGAAPLVVSNADFGGWLSRSVSIWKSADLPAHDVGPDAAAWFSEALGTSVRLVRAGPTLPRTTSRQSAPVAFADGYPWLVISEASLRDLNDRIIEGGGDAIPMNRFRPNIVLRGAPAFAEDTWPRFRIGALVFRAAGPCARCMVTTTDQFTGERGREPLRTLATYRRDVTEPSEVNFGQNLIHETQGALRCGDELQVLG